ncbi:MAG: phosphoadenylyl-sulfate reductase [Bacteroidota bacterium]
MNREFAQELNEKLQNKSSVEILDYIASHYPETVKFASSMGAEDQVITHIIANLDSPVEIFTLDTGRMFPETYDLIEKTEARYKLKIRIFFPDAASVEKMVNEKGINLFYRSIENRKQCCGLRKIEPLKRALSGLDGWITGLRKEQSTTRINMQIVEWDENNKMLKFNPLFHWTEEQLWDYIKKNNVPYNVLHDKGFPSIGCQPCTRAVAPGEDVRSGRWWWENPETKECGLHAKKD